jgi:ankyrin repeat protein
MPDQPSPVSMLAHALLNDRVDQVEALLRQGADILAKDARGRSLLAAAVLSAEQAGRPKSKSGRLIADAQGRIAELFLAAARALPADRLSLLDAVIARHLPAVEHCIAKAPPGEATARDYTDALTLSVKRDDADMLQLLLSAGADPNARVTDSDRPWQDAPLLGVAAASGRVKAIGVLLAHGAEVDARLPRGLMRAAGMTPLMMAAGATSAEAIRLLLEAGADPGAVDESGRTALQHARAAGHKKVIALLEKAAEEHDTAAGVDLWTAAATGPVYRVRTLIDAGANPDARDAEGRTPLMIAAAAGQSDIVAFLCAKGADARATAGADGRSDLWTFAFRYPKAEIIDCLLRHGLDPNRQVTSGVPPLVAALRVGDKAIVRALLDHGADVHATVPQDHVERVRRQRAAAASVAAFMQRRSRRPGAALPPEIGETCTVLDYAFYFGGTEIYEMMAGRTRTEEEPLPRSTPYLRVREALRNCAALAEDARFKAEVERLASILRARPQPWKRRRGVVHYVASLGTALRAHYETATASGADPRGERLSLLKRLQDEVAANGYTLAYTGLQLDAKGPARLILFPVKEPLVALAACGTNAANYGLSTADLIAWCEAIQPEHPFAVVGAGFDFVELGFALPLKDSASLARKLAELCPDLQVRADDAQAVAKFARELACGGRCFLWWD